MVSKYFKYDHEDFKSTNLSNQSNIGRFRSTSQPSFVQKTYSIINYDDQPGVEFELDHKTQSKSNLPAEYSAFGYSAGWHINR